MLITELKYFLHVFEREDSSHWVGRIYDKYKLGSIVNKGSGMLQIDFKIFFTFQFIMMDFYLNCRGKFFEYRVADFGNEDLISRICEGHEDIHQPLISIVMNNDIIDWDLLSCFVQFGHCRTRRRLANSLRIAMIRSISNCLSHQIIA